MTGREIIEKVKALKFPEGSYVVFGSCPLALAGIREANDVDFLVAKDLFEELEKSGWNVLEKSPDDKPLTRDVFEAHDNWNFSSYSPTLTHLLSTATFVENVPFAALSEVRKWKIASGRAKDLNDVALIDQYLLARGA